MRSLITIFLLCIIACSVAAMSPAGDTAIYARTYCSNQIIIINNHVYGPFQTSGIEIIPGGAANGMDSIFKVQLTFNQPVEFNYNVTICEGDSIKINNSVYHKGFAEGKEIFENAAANGCDSIVFIQLSFTSQPFSNLIDTLCSGESVTINGTRYDFDNRSGLETLDNAAYNGCDSLVYISLFFREQWVYLGPDTAVVEGDSLMIQLSARYGPESVEWSPLPPCTDPECLSFSTMRLTQPLQYSVIYTDTFGCVSRDEVNIQIDRKRRVYGANVFAPNSDEPNNRFFVSADRGVILIRQLVVFDRWGEVVFKAENIPNDSGSAYNMGWDGRTRDRDAPVDVYGWWAELETYSGVRFTETGDVTLVK